VASSPNFTFIGNVAIGNSPLHPSGCSVELAAILPHYDAIVFSYGTAKDRMLNIPGESTLKGIYSARSFVGWYNGLPQYGGDRPDLSISDEAVIIGQGNVALDIARMLLAKADDLRNTDITEEALATLSKSQIRRVHVVGRRGPMQVRQ
jgi:adrenodoxin-NADP+ reductase